MSLKDTSSSETDSSDANAIFFTLFMAVSITGFIGFNHFSGLLETKVLELDKQQSQLEKQQTEIEKLKQAEDDCRAEFRGYRDGRR